ncbi:hypothetical protein [Lacticaseibacillus mingshuiensis]|uniref:hypothetical protein n=1 Tax=Lacticaseibacillus mingshuiensis TaxID=2799574 RepID=UPI0019418A7F|nr:hypothetical protein [Lacticaseibacillus mingshuiensis]
MATIGLPAQVGKQGPVLFLDESFTDPTQMVVSLTAWAEGARFSQSLTEGLNPAGWYPGAESKAHIASPQRLNKVLGQVGRSMKAQLLWLPFRTFQLASGKQDPLYPYLIAILARVLAINASAFTVVLDQRSDIKVEQLTADLRHLAAFIYVETGRRVTLQGLLMDSKKSLGVQTADFLAFGGMHLLMPALAAFHIRRLEYDTLIGEPLYQRYTRLHREFAER